MKNKSAYILMLLSFFIYSLSSFFSKLASRYEMFSMPYIFCFCGIIIVLGLYGILWQQVLKNIDLSVAMAFKPLCLILSVLWSVIFFSEHLSHKMITGIVLIILGIFIISRGVHEK